MKFKLRYDNILTIDPGDNTAWALWERDNIHPKVGLIELDKKENPVVEDQLTSMWFQFRSIIQQLKPNKVFMEGVEVYGGSLKSMVAVKKTKHQKIPSLFKLSFLIGGYCNICYQHQIPFEIINFTEWGGQLPPQAVRSQVHLIGEKRYTSQHIYDAVMFGYYVQGVVK